MALGRVPLRGVQAAHRARAMKFARRQFLQLPVGAAVLPLLSPVAGAQIYPVRPLHLVVAFVPGGATDTLARQISNDLKEALGQPVVVENRPGANGYLAWNHVATAEPDGYTLLLAENALAISQALYRKSASSFDPVMQYDAVAGLATSPSALIVSNHVPANTVAELVAYSRTVPGKLNYASAGVGSVSHLNFEVFKEAVGMEAVHIPYKGGGQGIADVVAGHVPMMITSVQGTKSLVEARQIKALAVTSMSRSPAMPAVPTMKEAGVRPAHVELRFWFGLFGPKGMPDAVKAKLEKAAATVMADADVRQRLANLDITPDFTPGPMLRAKLESEIRNWTKFIDDKGIKPEL
jgi:tripartite-type tricarboxylate transporter receptor subunit TctC